MDCARKTIRDRESESERMEMSQFIFCKRFFVCLGNGHEIEFCVNLFLEISHPLMSPEFCD